MSNNSNKVPDVSDRLPNLNTQGLNASENPRDGSSSDILHSNSTNDENTLDLRDAEVRVNGLNESDSFRGFLKSSATTDGLSLGHYEIREVLGRGGFGVVLKAFDQKLHRVVAIKMMNVEMAATSPARMRFLREARASAAVRHENVVQIYAVEEEPIPYLVMEYIPGDSLQSRLDRSGPLGIEEVLKLGVQIARGLAAAHETNLVHRDIKPANILLTAGPDTSARLTDFGLARAADDASLTQSGVVAGTPMYMAPEQANGEAFDHRADLFSLGSVLYVMASGRPPFRAQSSIAVLKRVVEDTPRPIREIIPEVPQWLCDIISKLHAKRPEERYQSAKEVADVLADCLTQYQAHGTVRDLSRIPKQGSAPASAPPIKRNWQPAIIGSAVILLLAALQVGGVFSSKPKSVPPPPAVADENRFVNPIGMEFVKVPAGKSWLGGKNDQPGERVFELTGEYYLGRYEVTQEEWTRLMPENPSHFSRTGSDAAAVSGISDDELKRFPVDSLTFDQAREFIRKLNAEYPDKGWVYRLPTSNEWEYACRGGPMTDAEQSRFNFYLAKPSNDFLPGTLNCKDTSVMRTTRVGSYAPNSLGLHDMHGNVFEYCDDDVARDGEILRVLRGGTWHDPVDFAWASSNSVGKSNGGYNGAGFRIARVRVK